MKEQKMQRLDSTAIMLALASLIASMMLVGCASMDPDTGSISISVEGEIARLHRDGKPMPEGLEAWRWLRRTMADENGEIPHDAWLRAIGQRQANLDHWQSLGMGLRASIDSAHWRFKGPYAIAGRTRALLIHPGDSSVMWAAAASGGIWKTEDGGESWRPLDDFLPTLGMRSLTMDPVDPDVIYAGTGEAVPGAGIFRTLDGGTTWDLVPGTENFGEVYGIAIAPDDSGRIHVACDMGLMRSLDRGQTWVETLDAFGRDIKLRPGDSQRLVASAIVYDYDLGDWINQIIYSNDAGTSWAVAAGLSGIQGFFERISIAYSPSQPDFVYANVARDGGTIWRSTDGGVSFVQRSDPSQPGCEDPCVAVLHSGWWQSTIWVSPSDPSFVVAGGVPLVKSTDGGLTMTRIQQSGFDGQGKQLGWVDHHCIVEDPNFDGVANRRVLVCNDSGVYETDDIVQASVNGGWEATFYDDLHTSQFYAARGRAEPFLLVGGTQDNGTIVTRGNPLPAREARAFGGDGGIVALDPVDPDILYSEYQFLGIIRLEWTVDASFPQGAYRYAANLSTTLPDHVAFTANFIAPFVLDPNDRDRMFAGGRSLWRSEDVRLATDADPPVWTEIRLPDPTVTDPQGHISAIAVAPQDSNQVWVAQSDGKIFRSDNALAPRPKWSAIDDNDGENPLPDRFVNRIVISSRDPRRVWIGFGGFTAANLWHSNDGGATWVDQTGLGAARLPDAPVRSIVAHPESDRLLYLGSDVGLFVSEDGGHAWSASNAGPANVSIHEVSFLDGSHTLLVGTHGRGLWTVAVGSPQVFVDGFESGDTSSWSNTVP